MTDADLYALYDRCKTSPDDYTVNRTLSFFEEPTPEQLEQIDRLEFQKNRNLTSQELIEIIGLKPKPAQPMAKAANSTLPRELVDQATKKLVTAGVERVQQHLDATVFEKK